MRLAAGSVEARGEAGGGWRGGGRRGRGEARRGAAAAEWAVGGGEWQEVGEKSGPQAASPHVLLPAA